MTDLIRIIKAQASFLSLVLEHKKLAAQNAPLENASATNVQRVFRGTRIRIDVKYKSDAATELERVFRGHLGRTRARNALHSRVELRQICLFQYFAVQIQRSFRGYYSRKYKRNHAARKAYFKEVADKNKEVLAMMENYANAQALRDAEDEQAEKDRSFKAYAENLHHLISTKTTPGVFNPPEEVMEVPHMNGLPVEEHIRCVVRDLLRTKGITKTGLVRDLHGSRKVPYVGLKSRLSLQASAPFDIAKEEKTRTKMLHRILIAGKESFSAGGQTTNLREEFPPLHAKGEPFMDAFANPLLVRGVPESQHEMMASTVAQKPLFVRPIDRPFVSRSGGNKSAVLPNDLFEVMAEAEETGGTAQRNLGVSTRFGIPDGCDNRVPGGSIPVPPPRVSSTMRTKRM
jgi:hypothetical protein